MARGGPGQVRHFAGHPAQGQGPFQGLAGDAVEFTDSEGFLSHGRCLRCYRKYGTEVAGILIAVATRADEIRISTDFAGYPFFVTWIMPRAKVIGEILPGLVVGRGATCVVYLPKFSTARGINFCVLSKQK